MTLVSLRSSVSHPLPTRASHKILPFIAEFNSICLAPPRSPTAQEEQLFALASFLRTSAARQEQRSPNSSNKNERNQQQQRAAQAFSSILARPLLHLCAAASTRSAVPERCPLSFTHFGICRPPHTNTSHHSAIAAATTLCCCHRVNFESGGMNSAGRVQPGQSVRVSLSQPIIISQRES